MKLPEKLLFDGWSGASAAEGTFGPKWKAWALRAHEAHQDERIPKLLYLAPPAPLSEWKSPQVGWGLVMADCEGRSEADKSAAADAPAPIRELLRSRPGSPVLRYRPEYNDVYLQIYRPDGTTAPLRIADAPRGIGRNKLPRYLLIYGSPQQVPWRLQYVLEAAAFVGRLDLPEEGLGNYISHLIDEWPLSKCRRDQPVVWSTDHAPDDITWLMRRAIAEPLANGLAQDSETSAGRVWLAGADATRENLRQALGASKPAWIVTTSHGMTGPLDDIEAMARNLGLPVDANHALADPGYLLAEWQPDGAIWYSHACCSAGSESGSNYADLLDPAGSAARILAGVGAVGARTAPLPAALLGAPRPLRAFIGHVEPTFDWTLRDPETRQVLTSGLCEALYHRMYLETPPPVGMAFSDYHAQISVLVSQWMSLLKDRVSSDAEVRRDAPARAVRTKLNAVDHQSCVILGDPTVAMRPFAA
jgi:hypothetical protein